MNKYEYNKMRLLRTFHAIIRNLIICGWLKKKDFPVSVYSQEKMHMMHDLKLKGRGVLRMLHLILRECRK